MLLPNEPAADLAGILPAQRTALVRLLDGPLVDMGREQWRRTDDAFATVATRTIRALEARGLVTIGPYRWRGVIWSAARPTKRGAWYGRTIASHWHAQQVAAQRKATEAAHA